MLTKVIEIFRGSDYFDLESLVFISSLVLM